MSQPDRLSTLRSSVLDAALNLGLDRPHVKIWLDSINQEEEPEQPSPANTLLSLDGATIATSSSSEGPETPLSDMGVPVHSDPKPHYKLRKGKSSANLVPSQPTIHVIPPEPSRKVVQQKPVKPKKIGFIDRLMSRPKPKTKTKTASASSSSSSQPRSAPQQQPRPLPIADRFARKFAAPRRSAQPTRASARPTPKTGATRSRPLPPRPPRHTPPPWAREPAAIEPDSRKTYYVPAPVPIRARTPSPTRRPSPPRRHSPTPTSMAMASIYRYYGVLPDTKAPPPKAITETTLSSDYSSVSSLLIEPSRSLADGDNTKSPTPIAPSPHHFLFPTPTPDPGDDERGSTRRKLVLTVDSSVTAVSSSRSASSRPRPLAIDGKSPQCEDKAQQLKHQLPPTPTLTKSPSPTHGQLSPMNSPPPYPPPSFPPPPVPFEGVIIRSRARSSEFQPLSPAQPQSAKSQRGRIPAFPVKPTNPEAALFRRPYGPASQRVLFDRHTPLSIIDDDEQLDPFLSETRNPGTRHAVRFQMDLSSVTHKRARGASDDLRGSYAWRTRTYSSHDGGYHSDEGETERASRVSAISDFDLALAAANEWNMIRRESESVRHQEVQVSKESLMNAEKERQLAIGRERLVRMLLSREM